MRKVFKFFGWVVVVMLVLGAIGNIIGEEEPKQVVKEEKPEPKPEVKQEEPKKEKPKEKPKEEPKEEKPEPKVDEQKVLEINYANDLSDIMSGTSNMMFILSDMFTQPSLDPSLLYDPNWRQGIVEVYASIGNYQDRLLSLEVPESLQEVHNLTAQSFEYIMKSRDRVLQGIDTLNTDQFYEATDLIMKSTELINQANLKLNEINTSRGY